MADADRIRNVARIITETYRRGHKVVVVLSAQGDTTDDLIEKAMEINRNPSKREMDMLLSTGEQISCALCAMAIENLGCPVISLTGWQAGVRTDTAYGNARIKRIEAERKSLDTMAEQKSVDEAVISKVEALAPPAVQEETLTVTFTVTDTKNRLIALREWMKENDYEYK